MSTKQLLRHIPDVYVVFIFAFIGGYIDAAGYLKLQGVFTSSITGNLVVACASVSQSLGVICRTLCSISFAFGAFISNAVAVRLKLAHELNAAYLASILVGFEAIMFIVIWIVGLDLNEKIDNAKSIDEIPVVIMSILMGFCMGIHNGATREGFTNFPATTVMTTTLVNVSATFSSTILFFLASRDIIRLYPKTKTLLHDTENNVNGNNPISNESNSINNNQSSVKVVDKNERKESFRKKLSENFDKLVTLFRPLFFFLLGAVIGAIFMHRRNFWSMCIPFFLTTLVIIDILWMHWYPPKTTNQ